MTNARTKLTHGIADEIRRRTNLNVKEIVEMAGEAASPEAKHHLNAFAEDVRKGLTLGVSATLCDLQTHEIGSEEAKELNAKILKLICKTVNKVRAKELN